MRPTLAILLLASAPLAAQSPVGMATRAYTDPQRQNWDGTGPRPIQTVVWYPTTSSAQPDTVWIGPPDHRLFRVGTATRNAPIAPAPMRYPLIVVSHGTGGSALQMMWLGQTLAAHGYIVAAVNHHGNTGAEDAPTIPGFVLWWERPRDLTVLIDRLLADSTFGPRIDSARIGAAGFSLGGYTMIEIAGGTTNWAAYRQFCKQPGSSSLCDSPPEFPTLATDTMRIVNDPRVQAGIPHAGDSYRDPRVKAVFAIAPSMGGAFTDADLRPIHIPVAIVIGDSDVMAPLKQNAARFAHTIPGATLGVLHNVRHYTFIADCTTLGRQELPQICTDVPSIDRTRIHTTVADSAAHFFDRTVAGR